MNIDFALTQPAVRGVTFQPVQQAGRMVGFESKQHRLTLTEVRRRILEQTGVFRPEDLIPVPCHPDALAMAYALKMGDKTVPLTGMIPPEVLIDGAKNTIIYEQQKPQAARSYLQVILHQSFAQLAAGFHAQGVTLLPAQSTYPARAKL